MKLFKNTFNGFFYLHWSFLVAFSYFMKGVTRELHIATTFFQNRYNKRLIKSFEKRWRKQNADGSYCLEFAGAKLPDLSTRKNDFITFARYIFDDVFLIPCFYGDNHEKKQVEFLDRKMLEGPYGYQDGGFDVTIKKNDIVIDAGAWIGDFSAYAASKGATAYAFEPVQETYNLLLQTANLNKESGNIYPIKQGLGSNECELRISVDNENSGRNSFVFERECFPEEEKISITTLDKFVEENKVARIDFIKADIEGAERDLLKGGVSVLKNFAPKLAICTYHLPDDPEVLEKLILDANPNYRIIHLRNKLFAAVVK